jgi:hypothetical protein
MNVLRILECLILLLLKLWRLNQYKMLGTFLPFCGTHAIGQVAVLLLIDARGRQKYSSVVRNFLAWLSLPNRD